MIVQPELRVASPPSEVSCVQSPETRPLNDTNQTATSDDIIDQTAISNPPSELNDIDLNSKLNNPNVKLPSSPILIANPSSIHTSVSKLSKSLPITTSLSDSTQLTSEDTVECSSVTNDHYHCRRRSESSLQPEVNHSLETLTLTPPSTSTSSSTTSTTLSTDTNLSPTITSLTLPSLALKEPAQTQTQSPAQLITIPKPETDIKRFFLQRHPDGRLLLVPFDAIVTATIQPQFAQASTTVQPQPEVDNNSAPNSNLVSVSTLPRSPLFRISLADSSSSTAFPLLSNSEISDPTSPLVITTAIIPQSPTIANEQLSISVPVTRAELLVVNSAGNTCDNSDESPALSVTHPSPSPQKNNSSSPTTSSSLPNSADSQTSTTMTSYIFAQQQNTAAGTQQQIQQQQTHQNHQQNSPLPPVETIFSVSDSHHHMNNHSLGQSHQNLSHLAHTHPQSISNSNLSMIHNNRASRFDDFDPLFADMSEQQFTPTTVINDHHIDYYGQVDSTTTLIEDDDEDEMLSASKCLPFGYYYDDQKMFNKLEMISSSLPSSTTSSSSPLLDALELNDLFTSSTTTNSGPPQHHQSHPQSQSHAHNHQQQQQSNSNQTISINLNPTLHHHHHQTSTHIKQEFSPSNTNSEQFQVFHSSYASSNGYGMAGYGQDPLISGRLSKTTSSTPEQALIKASDIKEENDDEMLAMMSWPEQVASGQHFVAGGSHGERPSIAHNTISSTSSPTVVNEFWSNGCQSALQSPTIATSSNGNHGGNGTPCLQDGQIFEDLLVPDLDDGSLEIENILSSQNQMFGSPPKLSNCLVGKDSTSGPNFARPSFVRQGHVGQPVHPTVLGELLLRDNVSTTPINGNNSSNSYLPTGGHPVGSILVLPPKTQSNDNQMQTSPTATIHHRPQAPTPLQQQQRSNAMQSNCPTLAALITRPTATIVSHPQPHHNPHQANHQSQQTLTNQPQPLHLRTIIANEMALHGMSNRNRNNSMSTDYSISSHDEGFASQQEDGSESDESAILSLPPEPDTMEGEMFYMNMSSATSQPIPIHNHPGHQQMAACMFQQPSTSFDDSEMLHHQHNGSVSEDEEEEEDDDDDESFYGDYNAEDLLGATTSDDVNNKWSLNMGRSRKGNEKRFFWQYNVQSKGPKAPKYSHSVGSFDTDSEDPHVFKETADPVFAEDCQIEGVKHSGKARRGDGNDLTPNPKKLLMIGLELKKLSKIINDLTPVTDVPAPSRDKTRKEKNKLASRACRLKKKAQHEANKIKLHGLHREHSKLMRTISDMRKVIQWNISARESMIPCSKSQPTAPSTCVLNLAGAECHVSPATDVQALMQDTVARNRPLFSVSTHTADFVNHVLDNVSAGVANGGIDDV